jgi:hypothetical protein
MKRNFAILIFAACLVSVITYFSPKHHVSAAAQSIYSASCTAYVPKDWGEYRGATSYGVAFEDNNGTLRFVKNPPCDLTATPRPDLEIHRKR